MTVTPHSVVLMASNTGWNQVRAFFAPLGYEIGEGVGMSVDGNAPATHRGAHMWLSDDELSIITGQRQLINGDNNQRDALLEDFTIVIGGEIIQDTSQGDYLSINSNGSPKPHFDSALELVGLRIITVDSI